MKTTLQDRVNNPLYYVILHEDPTCTSYAVLLETPTHIVVVRERDNKGFIVSRNYIRTEIPNY